MLSHVLVPADLLSRSMGRSVENSKATKTLTSDRLPEGEQRTRLALKTRDLLKELNDELAKLKDVFAPFFKYRGLEVGRGETSIANPLQAALRPQPFQLSLQSLATTKASCSVVVNLAIPHVNPTGLNSKRPA